MKRAWFVVATLAISAQAEAGVLADALARHDRQAVETLRAQRADAAARCTLGAVYAKRRDLPRAHLYLAGCGELALPDEIAGDVAKIARAVTRQLRDGDLSSIEILSRPDGLTAEISALPGETFTTPATVWVAAGSYEVKATDGEATFTTSVSVRVRSRTSTIIETGAGKRPVVAKQGHVDFTDEHAAEPQRTGPPPAVKRSSLVPDKYNRRVAATGPGLLADPLATPAILARPARGYWLGVRLGAGMFDDDGAAARVGGAVAGAARFALDRRWFVAARLDWTRRGGDAADALDVLGASAGAGATILDGAIQLAVIGQLRGELRLADSRDAMAVRRTGVAAAGGLELALPGSPITAGVRFEQGLTELVAGARDRAVLVELGVDWR